MEVKAVTTIVVLYILVAVGVSFCFWGNLHVENHPPSATIRNLVLIWGAPLATGLAVWRSIIAQKQADIAQKQADILLENQRRDVSRDQPKLLLSHANHVIDGSTEDGSTNKRFDGFTVANAGAVAVTITGVGAAFGIPVDDPDAAQSRPSLPLAPREWNGVNLRDDDLPVKLEPGGTTRFLFDPDDLERVNRPYQWRCQDSLGTVYKVEGWSRWSQGTLTYMELGAEFIEPGPSYQTWTL